MKKKSKTDPSWSNDGRYKWKIRSCLRVIFIDPCWAHEITKLNIRMRFQKCDDMRRNDVEKDVKLNLMAEKSQLFPFPSNRIVSKRTDKRCVPFFFFNDYVYCSLDIIVLEITDGNSIHCSLFVVLFVQSFFFFKCILVVWVHSLVIQCPHIIDQNNHIEITPCCMRISYLYSNNLFTSHAQNSRHIYRITFPYSNFLINANAYFVLQHI